MKLEHGALCAALAVAVALAAAPVEDAGKRWWSHIEFLASDNLEGRDTRQPRPSQGRHVCGG